jgi:membrane protease YdiL (CAAX protease family)
MVWAWLAAFWIACFGAGYVYTQQRGVPLEIVLRVTPAFLLEATLFLVAGVEQWRSRLERYPRPAVASGLTLAGIAPYAAASIPLGSFDWTTLVMLAGLAAAVAFWYVVLPHNPLVDLGLLALMAVVMIARVFPIFYIRPHPRLALEILGTVMWIRTGLFAMLSVRRVKGVGFGFWPSLREWRIGAVYFLVFVPLGAALAWWIRFASPRAPETSFTGTALTLVLTFFGLLWTVALAEEFFFRGLVQQWMSGWLKSEWAGLVAAALLFGSVHFWTGEFPNWRFAALASAAGIFYGMAYRQAKSIRASMVAHALTATTLRVFFS